MTTFDPTRFNAVGIATQKGLTNNAMVIVIGMVDRSSDEFIPVSPSERSKIFPTRGCVFAFDFFKYYSNWKDECICLCAKPNNNENIVDGEDFVWDWRDQPYIYGDKLIKLSKPLSEDGQENFNILDKKGILDVNKEYTYFISGERLYRYDLGQRLLPYWNLSSVFPLFFSYNENHYLLDDISDEDGKVDITTDDQLIEWYKKKVLRKEWGAIYEAKDFRSVDNLMTAELKTLKIPTNVFESRLGRIQSMTTNLSLTFDELEDLSTTPWFRDVIKESIDAFSDKYLEKVKKDISENIESLNKSHQAAINEADSKFKSKMDEINLEIELKKGELSGINSKIEEEAKEKRNIVKTLEKQVSEINGTIELKKKEVEKLLSRKGDIIEDFSIIKDVLGCYQNADNKTNSSIQIETIDDKCGKELPVAVPFRKNIESFLVKYLATKIDADEIITYLSAYNVLLLPDDATVSAIMHATRRCKYAVEYVGVAWKSFTDLWENGLKAIVDSAIADPDMIHFLVLRDINMSFIPSYLHPVLDMQSGLCTFFPGTYIKFPENLRILCTKTSDVVIPITSGSLGNIGCVPIGEESPLNERKKKAWELKESSFVDGYLPTSIFEDLPIVEKYLEINTTEAYIDEN